MHRNILIGLLVSFLLHAGLGASGFFYKKNEPVAASVDEVPSIALDLPPLPEPEEPEVFEDLVSDEPVQLADLAPPTQADVPTAVIDSPFVQQVQAPPPPGLNRAPGANIVIPTQTRPGAGGRGLTNIFDLAALDQRPEARVRINPVYPFDMRRSGVRGEVHVGFIVDTQGNVVEPYIVRSSHSGFEQAAIDAVLKWRFRPGRKGGAAVNTRVVQPLAFNLES
jgi:protein TonB